MDHKYTMLHWDDFNLYLFSQNLSDSNIKTIERITRRIQQALPHWSKQSILNFLYSQKQAGKKSSYINNYLKVLRHIDKYLGAKETEGIKALTEEDVYFDVLTAQEIADIIRCEDETSRKSRVQKDRHIYSVLYLLLSEMALRIEEALAITYQDWKGDYISIRSTKTNRMDDILISSELQRALTELKRTDDRIFPLTRQGASEELKRRCRILGINKKVSTHTFRRSFATVGMEAGLKDKWIQEKGRWKNANSMDKYIRKSKRHQREVLTQHPFTANRMTQEDKLKYAQDVRRQFEDTVRALNLPREELEKLLLIKSL